MRSDLQPNLRRRFVKLVTVAVIVFAMPIGSYSKLNAQEAIPQWIWGTQERESGEVRIERRFEIEKSPVKATLRVTADDFFVLVVNGKFLMFSENWRNLRNIDLIDLVRRGENRIEIKAKNRSDAAGVLGWLSIDFEDGSQQRIVTDKSWQTRPGGENNDDTAMRAVDVIGPLGIEPWGNPWTGDTEQHVKVAAGFQVEKLYDVPANEGSWVCLCNDGRGGVYVSDEKEQGIFHVRFDGQRVTTSKLPVELSGAQGMVVRDGKLYANISGVGLHVLTDSDADGIVDTTESLGGSNGRGEHGIHGLIRGEEPGQITMIAGNGSKPVDFSRHRNPVTVEDEVVPRIWAPSMIGRKSWVAPGGWVASYDPAAGEFDQFATGLRNAYDLARNQHGELFTYDSDEEWDLGMPWYRPTRIYHIVSGGEYGWRSGSDKWPAYYEDVLPPLLDVGPGSPVGMLSGRGAQFPERYRNAIFALDWTYGTMRALFLEPDGATYKAKWEEFVSGTPLPLTDAIIADDGSMLFITGGRKTPSALYRVTFTGEAADETKVAPKPDSIPRPMVTRRSLEAYHGRVDESAVSIAWPYLNSDDRFLRFAARVAVESQPLESWLKQLQQSDAPQTIITGVVALARVGSKNNGSLAQRKLDQLEPGNLSDDQVLGYLRAQALVWSRLALPEDSDQHADRLLSIAERNHPLIRVEVTRLMCQLNNDRVLPNVFQWLAEKPKRTLPVWGADDLLARNQSNSYGGTFARYLSNRPPEHQIQLATFVTLLADRWTTEQATRFFEWSVAASRYQGGAAYLDYLETIRRRAVEIGGAKVGDISEDHPISTNNLRPITVVPPKGPGRKWTTEEALTAIADIGGKVERETGRNLFHATTCVKCHQFDGEGGAIGPDLSNVRGKFNRRSMLESIIEPSKAISDQYGTSQVLLDSGLLLTGIVVEGEDGTVNVFDGTKRQTVQQDEIEEIVPSRTSMMPNGLADSLNANELAALVDYLLQSSDDSTLQPQ